MPRHAPPAVVAAASAGLRETLRRLGHRPARDDVFGATPNHVTVACSTCQLALSAVVDHAAERVELAGPALGLRCSGGRP